MRRLFQYVAQLGLTAVFAGFIGAILGGIAGLVTMALGLTHSGHIYGFMLGGAGLFAACSLALGGRPPIDEPDIHDEETDGPPPELLAEETRTPRLRLVDTPPRDDDEHRPPSP